MKKSSNESVSAAPLQICYHNMAPSQSLTELVTEEAEKLSLYVHRIIFCRVVIDHPHRHQRKGSGYEVSIEIGVPRDLLVVRHEPLKRRTRKDAGGRLESPRDLKPEMHDPYLTVRRAFAAASRQLEDYAYRIRRATGGMHQAI